MLSQELRLSVRQCVSASLQEKNRIILERDSARPMALGHTPALAGSPQHTDGEWEVASLSK